MKAATENLLLMAGFTEAQRVESFPFGYDDCANRVSTMDGLPGSLNAVAVKEGERGCKG